MLLAVRQVNSDVAFRYYENRPFDVGHSNAC